MLNESETPVMPKPSNSIKSPKRSKTQIPNEMVRKEIATILGNLRTEMIALKAFVVDQIYIMPKKSKYWRHQQIVKSLNDQINFLKSEIKPKNTIITMVLDYHKNKVGQPKPFGNRRENNTHDNHEYQFHTRQKLPKIKNNQ